jgi:hypothetical protein
MFCTTGLAIELFMSHGRRLRAPFPSLGMQVERLLDFCSFRIGITYERNVARLTIGFIWLLSLTHISSALSWMLHP